MMNFAIQFSCMILQIPSRIMLSITCIYTQDKLIDFIHIASSSVGKPVGKPKKSWEKFDLHSCTQEIRIPYILTRLGRV